jgi:ABC-type bacteriocin/lantibiotic exporter with double-glycine peptidase domain
MGIKLKVPLVYQRETMECWYASACMVAYYRRPGPRLGLPEKWQANRGITPADFVELAKAEGLRAVRFPSGRMTEADLTTLLKDCGPLWCAGRWDGVPHIVVLTGVEDDKVFVNDPSPYQGARVESLSWFDHRLDRQVSGCLMYSPGG